jgi:hypothetical protein
MMKKLLCAVITVMIVMSVCTTVGAETSEQRVERIYPNWKEDYEQWNNKELVDGYDIDERALVVGIVEHESRFQGDVGEKYRGLMQISTSKDVLKFLGVSKDELYNEKTNIKCGVKMLRYYLEKSEGNVERALCMYGCGEGNSSKRKTYCRPSQEIYILYKKYKNLFEQEEYNNFLLEELENRSCELEHLIKVSEKCDSKKRNYYEMRIKSIENEICEIEKMLG